MSVRILQNREGGKCLREIIVDRENGGKKTLGMLEPEPPQPAKTKNLSQKTMSSREASTRLSDEIGAKSYTRDEGTVGDS